MSGDNGFGIFFLRLGGLALSVAGALWYWMLPLWQALLTTFGLGVAVVLIWSIISGILQKRTFGEILRDVNVGVWICVWLVGAVSVIFGLSYFIYSLF
jgi:hypothetical protein